MTFRVGEEILSQVTLPYGSAPEQPAYNSETLFIVGWEDENGKAVTPAQIATTNNAEYFAVLRPKMRCDVRFIYANGYGLFQPAALWSRYDAARALYALLPDVPTEAIDLSDIVGPETPGYDACRWFAAMGYVELTDLDGDGTVEFGPDQPMDAESFTALLKKFFAPDAVVSVTQALPVGEDGMTKSLATQWLCGLLELDSSAVSDAPYYPDVASTHEAYNAIMLAGAYTGYTAEDFSSKTLDGFLWFDGYLYAWDAENNCFYSNTTLDTLYFDKNGRYTSGSAEVDGYVAALIQKRCSSEMTRIDMLESMHKFLRDENMYLVRNRYEAGATGWELEEAQIMLSTGKGNCYSFAGAMWALGRGLGYNTVSYSGTISKNYDPHGWTEIILDGKPYICDPEIQKQYWASHLYYDTFMLPYDQATGWQYEAPNRTT